MITAIIINPKDKKTFIFGGQTLENFFELAKEALSAPDHDVIYVTGSPIIDMVYERLNRKDV